MDTHDDISRKPWLDPDKVIEEACSDSSTSHPALYALTGAADCLDHASPEEVRNFFQAISVRLTRRGYGKIDRQTTAKIISCNSMTMSVESLLTLAELLGCDPKIWATAAEQAIKDEKEKCDFSNFTGHNLRRINLLRVHGGLEPLAIDSPVVYEMLDRSYTYLKAEEWVDRRVSKAQIRQAIEEWAKGFDLTAEELCWHLTMAVEQWLAKQFDDLNN